MQALQKRIKALEQASYSTTYDVMFIQFVSMGEVDKELVHIYDNHNNQWLRQPNETEREFKDKAIAETPRKENGVALMFGACSFSDANSG